MKHPSKNRLARIYPNLASIFLARLARSCTKSCKSCTKNEAFPARYEKSCKNLARKICKIIFLQDLIKILQKPYLANFSCKVLARFFTSCKKSLFLVQDLQDMCKISRKILQASQEKYLQDLHISCKMVFTGIAVQLAYLCLPV